MLVASITIHQKMKLVEKTKSFSRTFFLSWLFSANRKAIFQWKAWLESGIEDCKANELMPFIIQQMFDFDMEESILEKEIFSIPEKMALVFNYMDSFFFKSNQTALKKATRRLR